VTRLEIVSVNVAADGQPEVEVEEAETACENLAPC
jgi:hypothetical protein